MKTIIVPTDFSECSVAAYGYAAFLAEKTGAEIYLMHILDIPASNASTFKSMDKENLGNVPFMMQMMKLIKLRMKKAKAEKVFKNLKIKDIIEIGTIPEKTFAAVKNYKADMIVMGTHGVNGIQEKFIGSNAEKIVRNADIPVLTVKHALKNLRLETILFATDFSKEAELVLPEISKIAELFKARLILTKVVTLNDFEPTSATNEQITSFREKNEIYNYSTQVYYAYSREEGIRQVAENIGADVIALGTHGRHGLAHFFRGSIAEDVVSHASLPVMTLNFHKKLINEKKKIIRNKTARYESDMLYQIPSV